jgi:hypothetical protein
VLFAYAAVFVGGLLIGIRFRVPALLSATLVLVAGGSTVAALTNEILSPLRIILLTVLLQAGYMMGLVVVLTCAEIRKRRGHRR